MSEENVKFYLRKCEMRELVYWTNDFFIYNILKQ